MKECTSPIVAVDGPSGGGKGTLSALLAARLGWNLLDSGAMYRLVGLAAQRHGVDPADEDTIVTLAAHLDVRFEANKPGEPARIYLEAEDVTDLVRTEEAGNLASRVAVIPAVRVALLGRQRAFCGPPGLVADGRDMGTVVFPDAVLKIFLTASAEVRAQRRYKQLNDKGLNVNLDALFQEIQARDQRDMERTVSPLKPADDAVIIDTSNIGIDEVLQQVCELCRSKGLAVNEASE